MSAGRSRLTLATEGGYPFAAGGVSVWCDQLIRSMPEMDFDVVALTATRDPLPVFEMPDHVRSVTAVPLWSPASTGRPPRRRVRAHFREVHARLLASVLSPHASPADFATALRALYEYAQTQDLSAALTSDDAVTLLADTWRTCPPGGDDPSAVGTIRPPLGDAALVTMWLEHMLRPLSAPVAEGDLVHCASNGLAGLVALGAKWTRGTPFVVSEHGVYLRERYLAYRDTNYGWPVKSALLRLTRAITGAIYAEADIVAPGNAYNRRWELRGGADPDTIHTVYNGVDPEDFPASSHEPDHPTVVYVGRIDPLKDLETLIRAFALVVHLIPEARLRMFGVPAAGREGYLVRCQELVTELGLGASATFEGRAPSARDAYGAGHVVALTSISEGFPYTVIEAMSCGRPTVSTDVGGVAEAVGEAGAVVPARDPEAFAAACVRLLRDPELRARNGAAARGRVLELFTLDRSMTAFRGIYADVLARREDESYELEQLAPVISLARSA